MKKLAFSLSLILTATSFSHAETQRKTLAGYNFDSYKVPVYTGRKAPINFDKASKLYKTRISNAYAEAKNNFAGHYTVAMWGCGSDCVNGTMVDRKTGQVFGFPISDFYYGCPLEDNEDFDNDILAFRGDSRLLITCSCQDFEDEKIAKRTKTYHIRIWNEKTKQFEQVKDVETVKVY